MLSSIREETGSLSLLHFLLGLFLVGPEGDVALELNPSVSEVLLSSNSSFTVVCSGWDQVTWRLPQDSMLDGVVLENQGSSSILQLYNATWMHSGKYVCEEASSDQTRELDIFIPGQGPEEWFVPVTLGVVMKEGEEGTIPCVVSNPRLNVTLYERPSRAPVTGATYQPGRGFTGQLNDTSYVCVAAQGGEERESKVFYVFSIVVPKVMEVEMTVSGGVLRQGEALTVNCTVKGAEMVFFTWDFPRRQEIESLTDFLPNRIRSFVNISMATLADSGVYVCTVQDTVQGRRVVKNITVTVLERGYIRLQPSGRRDVSCLLHQTVAFSLEVDAHPPPTVVWSRSRDNHTVTMETTSRSRDNQTITMETTSITTTHLRDSRYVSTLTLGQVQMEQRGSYTATVSNDDDIREVVYNLQVTAPPRITSLSEVGGKAVLCVCEGAPPPTVTWYTCHNTHRCGNLTGSWQSLSAAEEGGALQDNISYIEERGVSQVRSLLTLQSLSSLTAVRCEARNHGGRRAWDLRLVSNSLFSQVAVLAAVLVLVVIAIMFFIILILLWRKKPAYEVGWKVIESVSTDGQQYTYVDAAHLPYNSAWEVPRDKVVLGRVLGSGAFGRVVEGTVSGLLHSHSTTKVTVKMLKSSSSAARSLMSELKILVHLGPHLNLVNLLGACTRGGPVFLITEFCCHGDLVDYLQRNKHTFLQSDNTQAKSDSDGGYMDMNKEEGVQNVAMQELSYADIEPAVYETPYTQQDQQEESLLLSDSPHLSLQDLLGFSYQAAQAMDFLSSRNCINRDLAARNVLVCEGKLVKICDFSLARDVLKDQNYVAKGNTFLPLRWMAPESIFQNIYTTQSDVWSYGVLLWEIFSLGGNPYPDLPMTQEFYSALKRGYRMTRPDHATYNMYDILVKLLFILTKSPNLLIYEVMKQCWEEKSESRPPFSSLVVSIGDILTDAYKKRYDQVTERFMNGENPAVVRSKPSPTRTSDQTDRQTENDGTHAPQVSIHQSEAEPEEAGPSHSAYIIPITDIMVETSGLVLDTATQETASPQVPDSPPGFDSHDAPGVQEVMSAPSQEAEGALHSPCTTEEESFL
ncbi:platelet-derived growth factor receptor beta-like [Diretmus argenteus]